MKNLLTSLLFLWSFECVLACPNTCWCPLREKGTWGYCYSARLGYFPTNFPNDTFYIELIYHDIKTINVKICSLYPELETLYLKSGQITHLQDDVFADCRNLKTVWVMYNALSTINSLLFRNLTNLVELDLSSNSITTIHPDTFSEVPNLERLYLNSNRLGNNVFYSISSLTPLTHLKLQHNVITTIPAELSNFERLQYVDLSNNAIDTIESGALTNLTVLTELRLSSISITNILEVVLDNIDKLSKLQRLYLSNNNIVNITEHFTSNFTKLFTLDLSNNLLTTIDGVSFELLTSLRYLILSNNLLSTIDPAIFINMSDIYEIRLSGNKITRIPEYFLVNKTYLHNLYLDDNKITDIHTNAFVNLKNIRELDLSRNSLSSLPENIFVNFKYLNLLSLQHNNLSSIPKHFLVNKTSIYKLHLYNNIITDIHVDAFVNLKYLHYLELQYNRLTTLDPIIFQNMDKLYVLNLQYNRIREIKSGMLENTNLNNMYLSSNPLLCDCGILSFYEWAIETPSIAADARCTSGKNLIYMTPKDFRQCSYCECYNGGSCVTKEDNSTACECVGNWSGEKCQVSQCTSYDCGYDVCYTEPGNGTAICKNTLCRDCECYNGGYCVTMEDNTMKCECPGNWTGERCQVSECAAYDCGNDVCYTEAQNGTAICKSSFVKDCECYNGGYCVTMSDNTMKCECPGNWTGHKCQVSQCASYGCGDDVCYTEAKNGTAFCKSSFVKDCECYNGGFCVKMENTIKCQCVGNWTGDKCQVSQCASYDCEDDVCYTEATNGTAYCKNSLCKGNVLNHNYLLN